MKNKYKIIYCDPPWQYKNQKTRAATNNHYPTLSIQDLKSLNIKSLADDNSVLIMWYTDTFAKEAIELSKAWAVGTLGAMSVRMIFSYKEFTKCKQN